jgi:2,5-diamino-6-(ribosylamino)-4(3H)-pyrimidinone 5'-phosphate reductase
MNRPVGFGKPRMRAFPRMDPCENPRQPTVSAMPRPWISTNLALSADGKISTVAKHPSGWTSRADHDRLIALRRLADALMVGHGTLKADRMTLTVRDAGRQPLRCVVSRHGEIDPAQPIFAKPGGGIHILATDSLTETLAVTHGVRHLHCEGGGQLIAALAALDVIDEFHATIAGHTLFGGQAAPTATGVPSGWLPESRRFEICTFEPCPATGECFVTWRRVGRAQCL